MKKIIAFILCLLIAFSSMSAYAYEFDFDFESEELMENTIVVNVSQQTILLNDEPVEFSEAPYVNENWDTMIELEVLANTLGAEVSAENDVYCVSISGVEMYYTLNSKEVTISGQTLLMNSEIVKTESGAIMAPLRFVSETLGADVTYDPESGDVTIVSSGVVDETANYNVLFKYSGKTKIGHSKEHWRFTKTENFDMAESYYSDSYEFAMGDIMFSFAALKKDDSYTLRKYYIEMQEDGEFYEEVMFDKGEGTHNGADYVFTKHRTVDTITENYAYETEEYFYLIEFERYFENFASGKESPEVSAVLESLEFDYSGGDEENTVDLATVDLMSTGEENSEYTDSSFNWTISLDDGWVVEEYDGFYNKVSITRPTTVESDDEDYYYYDLDPRIDIYTYSNVDDETIDKWSKESHDFIKNTANTKICDVSEVGDVTIGSIPAKTFTVSRDTEEMNSVTQYYFLNNSDYRHEIVFTYNKEEENDDKFLSGADYVIKSFVPGEIDKEAVGESLEIDNLIALLDEDAQFEGEIFKISYPCEWTVSETNGSLHLTENDLSLGGSLGILGLFSPQLSYLLTAADELSITASKESLSYYADDMSKQTYTVEEYMNKNVAQMLNLSGGLVEFTLADGIEKATLLGIEGYRVDVVIAAEGQNMYQTIYYLPYGEDAIVVRKNCFETYKNTVYEKALERAFASLELVQTAK